MTEAKPKQVWIKTVRDLVGDALDVEGYKNAGVKKQAWRALLGFALLAAASFFMLWLGDRINAPGMAVTRFMARAQAPLTAEVAYPSTGRGQISVVMYDQQFLKSQGAAWPISYQEHADWIGRLVELPGAKPRALMIDITFGQERNDPSIVALKDKLCEISRVHRVPVYLAALPDVNAGGLNVRDGLAQAQGKGEEACFTLVGVDYIPDPLDGLAWTYQLTRFFDGVAWLPGHLPTGSTAPQYRSAALAMAEDVEGMQLDSHAEPMALMWGFKPEVQTDRPDLISGCHAGEPDWRRWVPRLIRQLWESGDRPALCPYHRSLSFAQVAEMEEAALSEFVGGKFVFVGAQVPGYNDFAHSPIRPCMACFQVCTCTPWRWTTSCRTGPTTRSAPSGRCRRIQIWCCQDCCPWPLFSWSIWDGTPSNADTNRTMNLPAPVKQTATLHNAFASRWRPGPSGSCASACSPSSPFF